MQPLGGADRRSDHVSAKFGLSGKSLPEQPLLVQALVDFIIAQGFVGHRAGT